MAQVPGGQGAHGAGEFGVDGLLGQRAQPAYEGGGLRGLGIGGRMVEEGLEDMLGGEVQEAGGDVLDLAAQFPQMTGDRQEGDAGGVEFGGDGEFLRAGDEELVVLAGDALQDAQFDGLGDRFLVGGAPEGGVQVRSADAGRLLIGPRPVDLGDQAQYPAQVEARVPGREEFLDAGEGVTTVEQIGDLAQPGQMGLAVDVGPATAFRAGSSPGPDRRGSCGPWRR